MSGMENDPSLALVHARLKGVLLLNWLAHEAKEGPIKTLAVSALIEDLKRALLVFRRRAEWQFLAEGWMALLKGDLHLAEGLFEKASLNAPTQAKAGKELIGFIRGGAIGPLLSSLKPYASRFPQLAKTVGWVIERPSVQLDSLQTIAKSPLPRSIHGWVELSIGDYLAPNSIIEAIWHWDKALKLNSERCSHDKFD